MGRFDDRATQPARGPLDLLRWKLGRIGAARIEGDETPAPMVAPDLDALASTAPSLTWIGHASFVVRLGGLAIAIDPIWGRAAGTMPRKVPAGVPFEALPPIDVVLVTHNHFDHMDLPTLRRIGPKALYVVPLGEARRMTRAGLRDVVELDWWQSHAHRDVEFTLVPARHWSMRAPWNRNDALWGGYVIRSADGTAYHSGDTALFDGFAEIGARLGPIDWAMLPIGAYEPRWFMEPQHMNPEDAGQAFAALGARNLVAMHWGTFKLTDEPIGEPPIRTRALWAEQGLDPSRLWILGVGETRRL